MPGAVGTPEAKDFSLPQDRAAAYRVFTAVNHDLDAMQLTKKQKAQRAQYMRDWRKRKKKEAEEAAIRDESRFSADLEGWRGWAESELVIPSGPLRGRPFKIDDWQFDFLLDAHTARESGLSVARKNGKSGLIAAYLLGYLDGPLNFEDFRGVVCSVTGELAKELRLAMRLTAEASGLEIDDRSTPTPGQIFGRNGSQVKFLASDKATGHAIGADIALIDEAGLLGEDKRELWNAILTSTSGRDGRLMCISIQALGPMFAELRDRAEDVAVAWHEYTTPLGMAIDDPAGWALSNPGLASGIKSESYMVDMARRALSSPADQPSFRAYDLNQPQEPGVEPLCTLSDWLGCIRPPDQLPPRAGGCVVGIDLGGSSSMCALVAFWPSTGRAEAFAAFPAIPGLVERGKADGVGNLYARMEDRGELRTYPGRVTPIAPFLEDCAGALEGEHVIVAGADRFRRAEALQAMADAGVSWSMEWRGQGAAATADGSHDVRAFQRYVLRSYWAMVESLVFESAVSKSQIRRDGAGNPALERATTRGRIDVCQAAVIAAGLGELTFGPIHEGPRVVTA